MCFTLTHSQTINRDNMNQTQIADAVGVTPGMISRIKKGQRRCSWDVAVKLGRLIGRDPAFFMEADAAEIRAAIEEAIKGGRRVA